MARGNVAKSAVIEKIKQTFGNDFVAVVDGKVYVWANDGSERVQICMALTCPKNFVGEIQGNTIAPAKLDFGGGGWDFEAMDQKVEIATKSSEISQAEQDNIEQMMRALGLM